MHETVGIQPVEQLGHLIDIFPAIGLIPQEDTGTVMVSMNTKPGSSMAQTNKVMARINSRHCLQSRMHHRQVVQSARRYKFIVQSHKTCRSGVI